MFYWWFLDKYASVSKWPNFQCRAYCVHSVDNNDVLSVGHIQSVHKARIRRKRDTQCTTAIRAIYLPTGIAHMLDLGPTVPGSVSIGRALQCALRFSKLYSVQCRPAHLIHEIASSLLLPYVRYSPASCRVRFPKLSALLTFPEYWDILDAVQTVL